MAQPQRLGLGVVGLGYRDRGWVTGIGAGLLGLGLGFCDWGCVMVGLSSGDQGWVIGIGAG